MALDGRGPEKRHHGTDDHAEYRDQLLIKSGTFQAATDLGGRYGDQDAFTVSYFALAKLYEVVDTHKLKLPTLQGMTPKRARGLATEFISKEQE